MLSKSERAELESEIPDTPIEAAVSCIEPFLLYLVAFTAVFLFLGRGAAVTVHLCVFLGLALVLAFQYLYREVLGLVFSLRAWIYSRFAEAAEGEDKGDLELQCPGGGMDIYPGKCPGRVAGWVMQLDYSRLIDRYVAASEYIAYLGCWTVFCGIVLIGLGCF